MKIQEYAKLREQASEISRELYYTLEITSKMSSMSNIIRDCKKAIYLAKKLENIRKRLY